MRLVALLALLLASCAGQLETMRPATGGQPAVRAIVQRPEGVGPFPVAILLHGSGGRQANTESWASMMRGRGYLVITPDQFGPRGISDIYTTGRYNQSLFERIEDTFALLSLLGQRSDVRSDAIFLIGFSHGGRLAAAMLDEAIRHRYVAAGLTLPAGAVGIYSDCNNLPSHLTGPLLLVHGEADDWSPVSRCEAALSRVRAAPVPPELLVIPGAHHGFDEVRAVGLVMLRGAVNSASPTGRGATIGYSAAATRQAQEATLAFVEARR